MIFPLLLLGGAGTCDLATPLGVAAGVLYVLSIIATLRLNSSRMTWIFMVVATGLIVMGWWLSPGGEVAWKELANRIISILAVWVTTFIVTNGIRTSLSLQSLYETYESETGQYTQTLEDQQQKLLKIMVDRTQDQSIIEERTTALERQEKQFRQVIETAPNGLMMVDQEGNIVLINQLIMRQFGYEREELIGKKIEVLIPERFQAQHPAQRTSYFLAPESRQMGQGRELYGRRKDGAEFPIEIGLNPLTTEEGSFVLASVVDITERKQAQEALIQREAQNRLIIDSAPNGMVMIDSKGFITLANEALTEQFGYSREELLGQSIEQLVPLRFQAEHPSHRADFLASPHPRRMGSGRDLYGLRKDGSEFPVEIGLNRLTTEGGSFVLASVVDISARKKAEEKFRLVVEAAPSGIVMVNPEGNIVLSNEKITQQFGYTSEVLVGKKVEVLLPARFRAQHGKHCANFFVNLGWREMGRGRELFGLRQDGTEFQVEVALNPIATEEGTFVLASVVDITERKEVEKRIQALHQHNELLLASAAQGIYGLDVEGKTTFVNPAAAAMLGYSPEELIGCPMHATMHYMKPDGSLYPREECPMYAAFMDGTPQHVEDEILWRKDGTSFPVTYTSTPMRDENQNIIGAVVTFSDISARKENEQALLKWNQALETSNQELDDFAYIASHDLKEPLRGIHNYSKILLEDHGETLDDEAQARCETILRLTRHMETLLDTLLYFSRVGRSELAVGPMDLDSVLGNVLESLDISLKERGILIQVPQIFPTVVCDGTRVGEIFRNLITNAMKYNDKSEKWIEIGYLDEQQNADEASRPLVFFVRDNGIGIREKHLGSIFRIFKRLHGREKFGGGTGAGLTMTKKMVERHGGRIWVESTYGEGSTFYFMLEQSQVAEGVVSEARAISQAVRT